MKKRIIAAWVLTALVAFGATPQEKEKDGKSIPPAIAKHIEFAGYSSIAKDRLFVLYDADAKESSLWIKLGQTWRGYTVRSFDPKTERLTLKMEKTELILSLRNAKVGKAVVLPGLVKGTYTLLDGTLIYSPDAQLKLGTGVLVSSPTGLMVSDDEQKIVGGDLAIETGNGVVNAQDAVVDVAKGVMTAESVSFDAKAAPKASEPKMASTTPAVTPSAPERPQKP